MLKNQCIRVAVRIRPLLSEEETNRESSADVFSQCENVVSYSPNVSFGTQKYEYDCVFDHLATIEDIFTETSTDIIHNATNGSNGSIFTCVLLVI